MTFTSKKSGDLWDDARAPGLSLTKPLVSAPDLATFRDNIELLAFSKTTDESAYGVVQLSHRYDGGDIKPHVHWSPGVSTDTGDVVWGLEYTIANVDGTMGATTTITATDAADGTAYKHQVVGLGTISDSSYRASCMILFRVYRDANAAGDTFDADAFLLEVDFHYLVARDGSPEEFPT